MSLWLLAPVSALAPVFGTSSATPLPTDKVLAEQFVAWATETAIPLDLDTGVDPLILEPLVEGKRFVYLGEPDHYIQEKYPFRLEFLYALHELGWRHLGMEMGRSSGLAFDRFLESGDEAALNEIGLYQAMGRSSAVRGSAFLHQEILYAHAVRELAAGPDRVHYFGFDLDMVPGHGIHDANARLAELATPHPLSKHLEEAWSADDRVKALRILITELTTSESGLAGTVPKETRQQLVLDLEVLAESLEFRLDSIAETIGTQATWDMFSKRERTMFRIMDSLILTTPADEGIVLTGHNMHLSRAWEGARWTEPGATDSVRLWPTIGSYIAEQFPDEVFALWLVYDHGSHLGTAAGGVATDVPSVPGTVESLLARVPHDSFLLPLASDDPRARWLDGERKFRVNGGVAHGPLHKMTDALFFIRTARPPQGL